MPIKIQNVFIKKSLLNFIKVSLLVLIHKLANAGF